MFADQLILDWHYSKNEDRITLDSDKLQQLYKCIVNPLISESKHRTNIYFIK